MRLLPLLVLPLLALAGSPAVAIEKPKHQVVRAYPGFEVREYATYLVAETEVTGTREEAGNRGFQTLAAYIFGKNKGERKLAMAAPVTQSEGTKLAMTAPVTQTANPMADGTRWTVQFLIPSAFTLATVPEPFDPAVVLREVPSRQMAALRYSGTWSEARYQSHLQELRAAMAREGLKALGEPVWARYDPPFMPWFMRTNEILIEVGKRADTAP